METLWQHRNKNLSSQFPEYMWSSCKKPWTFLMYIRWNQNQLTRPKCYGNPKNKKKKKKKRETIDTNKHIMTFNTHKVPKEIKIGYQKINVEPYIPNPLRCYKCQRFGHHQEQRTRLPVCRRCREYDIHYVCHILFGSLFGSHYDCQKDYKCANCQGNHGTGSRDCEVWKKEKEITKLKHTQNITYPEARRMVETTKYTDVTKKISQQSKKQSC